MSSHDDIAAILRALHTPIYELQDLLPLLIAPLKAIVLLPPGYEDYNAKLLNSSINIPNHIPLIQHALIEKVVPTWEFALRESGNLKLLEQYFCPVHVNANVPAATEVITLAYSTIISDPLTDFSVHLLQRLTANYPMVKVYKMIFPRFSTKQEIIWEDYVRNSLSIPTRVANRVGVRGCVSPSLESASYLQSICIQCEQLIAYASSQDMNDDVVPAVVYLLSKLIGQGVFPPTPPVTRSQVSFFKATMPSIRRQLEGRDLKAYSKLWSDLTANLPPRMLQSLLRSMFATLQASFSGDSVLQVKATAQILQGVLGAPFPDHHGLWECVSGLLVDGEWPEILTQGIVCWISGASFVEDVNVQALRALLDIILSVWTSRDHINYSFISRHRYLTMLLLVTVSYLPSTSEEIQDLILSPSLITAIGYYISHMDESVRLCGMLVAEILSSLAGKVLTFDVWKGEDEARLWALRVRGLIEGHNANATRTSVQGTNASDSEEEILQFDPRIQDIYVTSDPIMHIDDGFDSDDSVNGYAPSVPSPSRSPTPAELAEIEKEPILSLGIKKIFRPLYLSQLGALLRSQADGGQGGQCAAADNIEMALNSAEDLIRCKKFFGSELDENATNLVHALLGLQDNYDIPQFDTKRQAALSALVSSCPRLAAPCIIEEFFKPQYSVAQRFAALEALAFGAQELNTVQPTYLPDEKLPFPSLSHSIASKHEKQTTLILMDEAPLNTTRTRESSSEILASPCTKLSPASRFKDQCKEMSAQSPNHTSFTSLSTPFFISPLVSRFWLFLRDERSREQRTRLREERNSYYGAGTGLILNPVTLAQFLRTVTILTRLSRLCPEWLAFVAPDSLEIALAVGTLPISRMELDSNLRVSETADDWERKEAAVLTAALELVLVVLDGCLELDRGRFLSLQRTSLLKSTSDWGRALFSRLNQGLKVSGGGGAHETALMRAVTGVLLKVEDIMTYWSQSMAILASS